MIVKKHHSPEFPLNKEPASYHQADTKPHPENHPSKKKNSRKESETERATEHKEKKPHVKPEKTKRGAEKNTPEPDAIEAKEEKRVEAIEKSVALKKHFEDIPIPQDPHLVARLIVADYIISLHEQIENPDETSAVSSDKLVTALDYMGELAEKLEDPTSDTNTEIQEAYEALLEFTERALEHITPEEVIDHTTRSTISEQAIQASADPQLLHAVDNSEKKSEKTIKKEDLKQPLAAILVANTIASLPSLVSSKNSQQHIMPSGSGYAKSEVIQDVQAQNIYTPATSPQLSRLSPAEARSEYLRSVAREHHIIRPIGPAAAPIAALAITSTLHSHSPEATPAGNTIVPPITKETSSASPFSQPQESYHSTPSTTSSSPLMPRSTTPSLEYASSGINPSPSYHKASPKIHESLPGPRKFEHLPLQTLLTMASTVPVGYGRYLRKEFEQNHIDREGLIKILKARAKGKDFTREFHKQAENFRLTKASPEFLSSPPLQSTTMDSNNTGSEVTQTHETNAAAKEAERHDIPKPHMTVHATATPLMTPQQPEARKKPTKWLIVILITIVCVSLVAFLFFVFL